MSQTTASLLYWLQVLNPLQSLVHAPVTHDGLRMLAYKRDVVGRRITVDGVYEPHMAIALKVLYGEGGGLFVDVGANIGYHSCWAAVALKAPVLAIEAEPLNYKVLCANLARNGCSTSSAVNLAVGETHASLRLHLYKPSNRGRHSAIPSEQGGRHIDVPMRPLDSILQERGHGSDRIRCIKMDIEGYELAALRGAGATLARTDALIMEWSPDLLQRGGFSAADLQQLLAQHFSTAFAFREGRWQPHDMAALTQLQRQQDILLRR